MTARLLEIQDRKQTLIAECAGQRAAFAEAWRGLERPVTLCQRTLDKLRSPWLWAGLSVLAFKLPTRRLLRIPLVLWKGWRLARRMRSVFG